MKKRMAITACVLACSALLALIGCASGSNSTSASSAGYSKDYIEKTLNLANNKDATWSYSSDASAWTLGVVSAVAYPVIADEEGVSVCVPAAYVKGIDSNGDGTANVTASSYSNEVSGTLVIDYDAQITSTNGQVYTAKTAPLILNTGAAGYSSSTNTTASTTYAAEGFINIACGNRGKQDSVTDSKGSTSYTGDAPSCLVDQKAAARFVKYNIALGNLPGDPDRLVTTGGSGGGAHAAMFAATSNNPVFYDYQIDVGAVGVYANNDGTYSTTISANGKDVEISDGAWGCIAYSAITPLAEGDLTMAFEYSLDKSYGFGSTFQAKLAEILSTEYMDYINAKNLSASESAVNLDVNGDGDKDDTIALKIEYDKAAYPDTNGYGGSYLDLYLAQMESQLQWYVDNLAYAEGWTWFNTQGNAMSDSDVAAMTAADRTKAFIAGRYAKGSSGHTGGPGGDIGKAPGGAPSGNAPGKSDSASEDKTASADSSGDTMEVGTPDAGTTQASGSSTDSSTYASYADMLAAYESDIAEIQAGDTHGNNIVNLYNPLNYIGDKNTTAPQWSRVVMGAAEGDMSMFASLNMQLAWLANGTDAKLEWQWDGGHVPSEILGESLALYVDEMYGTYVDGAVKVEKPAATAQTTNGSASSATGTDISSWVNASNPSNLSFSLAAAAAYRTAGASKAIPGFDTIDYGQEDYVFGSTTKDARHWDTYVLKAFQEHRSDLESLFNASKG